MRFEDVLPALRAGKIVKNFDRLYKMTSFIILEQNNGAWIAADTLCFTALNDFWEVVEDE